MKKIVPVALLIVLALITPLLLASTSWMAQAATRSRFISFSGYTWYVEDSSSQRVNPGPNIFSNSEQNVWVDTEGFLHLKMTNINGRWICPEVTCTQALGYGTYAFYLASRIDNLDKNVVVGLFAYKDSTHEVDIEFSKWGLSNYQNSRYAAQPDPYIEGQNKHTFNTVLYGDYTTQYFTWKPSSIYFGSIGGHYTVGAEPADNIIQSFTMNRQISATGAKAHINIWLYQGMAPSNGLPVELVVKSFKFSA